MRSVIFFFTAGFSFTFLAFSVMAIEQPDYEVLEERNGYEIRSYPPYIVAEVKVDEEFRRSGSSSFNVLAGYIFGDNQGARKMEMTAPVTSDLSPQVGKKMKMTAPVTSVPLMNEQDEPEGFLYQFVMERKFSLETLPEPNDPRVKLRELPERIVAVRRYSGSQSGQNVMRNLSSLMEDLERDNVVTVSGPQVAFYDGPWTPSSTKRNEVMLEIDYTVN